MKLLAAVSALALVLTVTALNQHQTIKAERQLMTVLKGDLDLQNKLIVILEVNAQRNAQESAELTTTLQQVQQLAGESRQIWETLKRENEEFKAWANSALPADVIRLRSRPAITGAAGYQSWLQQSNSLHSASQPAENQ